MSAVRRINVDDVWGDRSSVRVDLWIDKDGDLNVQVEAPKAIQMARPLVIAHVPYKRGKGGSA